MPLELLGDRLERLSFIDMGHSYRLFTPVAIVIIVVVLVLVISGSGHKEYRVDVVMIVVVVGGKQ